MAANTEYLESTPAVFSSISLNGSGGTLSALAIVASNMSTSGKIVAPAGTAIAPTVTFASEQSLGFYRSAASIVAASYGFFSAPGLISSSTTAQSASSAKIPNQGQIVFSILSLTTNGAAMYYRSGNSVYGWPSSLAVG